MDIIAQLEKEQAAVVAAQRAVPEFGPGDTVIVNVKVKEGERSRVQAYEGVCIARSGGGLNENFTVRKMSYGEGVERVFPIYSPMIDSIKVVRRGAVRRAKLYYLRGRTGKSARIAEKQKAMGLVAAAAETGTVGYSRVGSMGVFHLEPGGILTHSVGCGMSLRCLLAGFGWAGGPADTCCVLNLRFAASGFPILPPLFLFD